MYFTVSSLSGYVPKKHQDKVFAVGERARIPCFMMNANTRRVVWMFRNKSLEECHQAPMAKKGDVCVRWKHSGGISWLRLEFENIQIDNSGTYTCNEYGGFDERDLINSSEVYVTGTVVESRLPTTSLSVTYR